MIAAADTIQPATAGASDELPPIAGNHRLPPRLLRRHEVLERVRERAGFSVRRKYRDRSRLLKKITASPGRGEDQSRSKPGERVCAGAIVQHAIAADDPMFTIAPPSSDGSRGSPASAGSQVDRGADAIGNRISEH